MPLNKTSTQLLDRSEPLELVLMLDSFSGGENTIGEDQELAPNMARSIQNWDSISVGGMVRSNGFTKQVDATGSYTAKPLDMVGHHYEGTSVRNYGIINGDLGRVNGSSFTVTDSAAFTAGILSHSQTAGSAFWITNTSDNLKYTTIAGSITVPTSVPSVAHARIYYHKSRLIAEGGSAIVEGSRAGSGTATWAAAGGWSTSGDAWNITMPDLTQGCIPGFPSPDQVTVFTLGATFYLYNFPNIAYQPVNINRGCSAPYSIAYGKEGAFFVSQFPTLGVFLWDTINFTNLTLYEGFVNDINFSNRIFGTYRGNQYYLFYSSIANGNSYPDTLKVFDTRFSRWMSRTINAAVGDTFGYPKIFAKPTNDIWVGSSQKAVMYQLESGTSDATQTTNANYLTKDFTSDDFTIDGQAQFPLSEVRMKLLKVSVIYYGTTGNFTLQWTADRGIRSGAQVFDLTGVGDLINTTFIVNTSYIASLPLTKTVTRSFDNSAIGSRFNFQILQNGSGVIPEIKRIKIFALALQES